MSQIGRAELLGIRLREAFSSSEIRHLVNLLDNETCDLIAEKRAKYEPLLDDLNYLADVLAVEGCDYGCRERSVWAVSREDRPKDTVVNVICPCGKRLDVKITEEGHPLSEWRVECPLHHGDLKKTLGTIDVDGIPGLPINAQLIVQQVLVHHEERLNNDRDYVFEANAKF